jgi:hypothetical protein
MATEVKPHGINCSPLYFTWLCERLEERAHRNGVNCKFKFDPERGIVMTTQDGGFGVVNVDLINAILELHLYNPSPSSGK